MEPFVTRPDVYMGTFWSRPGRNSSKWIQYWTCRKAGPVLDPFGAVPDRFLQRPRETDPEQKDDPVQLSDGIHFELGRVLLGPIIFGSLVWLFFFVCVCVLLRKNRFWLVWLINFFNQLWTWLKWLKTMGSARWHISGHQFSRVVIS